MLYDTSGKSPSPPPVADTSIVAQPSILPEAPQGTILEAAKDTTELMVADLNKEKAAPTADVVASSSKPASWTDHVSASVITYT